MEIEIFVQFFSPLAFLSFLVIVIFYFKVSAALCERKNLLTNLCLCFWWIRPSLLKRKINQQSCIFLFWKDKMKKRRGGGGGGRDMDRGWGWFFLMYQWKICMFVDLEELIYQVDHVWVTNNSAELVHIEPKSIKWLLLLFMCII